MTANDIPNEKDCNIKLRFNMEILINAVKDIHKNIDHLSKVFGDKRFSLIVDKSHTEEAPRTLKDRY